MNPLSSILLAATGIEADRSATFTSTVVIAGIVIVLGILVLLIFVFKAFGAIVHGAETRGKKKKLKAMESQVTVASAPSAPAVKAAPAAPAPVVDSGIPGEVVAVIAAAGQRRPRCCGTERAPCAPQSGGCAQSLGGCRCGREHTPVLTEVYE